MKVKKKMPGGDKTGPLSQGPRTGRALGFCAGFSTPGFAYQRFGPRFGRGRGQRFGRGLWAHRRGFYWSNYRNPYINDIQQEMNNDDEKIYLETMMKNLEEEINQIKKRLEQLTKVNK
jgi:hypothetical protein